MIAAAMTYLAQPEARAPEGRSFSVKNPDAYAGAALLATALMAFWLHRRDARRLRKYQAKQRET